jgi:hypothetical protein
MVWNFKPQLRAFRFAGHKVRTCQLWLVWAHGYCNPAPVAVPQQLCLPTVIDLLYAAGSSVFSGLF